ncbi:unnamed protein product [Phyllotreta striolata]|uniref:SAM domain-containing protein n=1 Tax=Phyllotreta striolata TaxID=444603 RepID=A0A9N9TIH1_PHYSR|nr:unnamed protein product [Phyllotreta striolata]
MDLLETILRSSGFEKYHEEFKKQGIDTFTLKILSDKDLKLLGIESEEQRKLFLKCAENLQIPSEKKISLYANKSYAKLVLQQMSLQLQKQMASLNYILKRKDVDICNVKLSPSVSLLQSTIKSLDDRVDEFEREVLKVKKRSNKKKYVLIPSFIVLVATVFACGRHLVINKL